MWCRKQFTLCNKRRRKHVFSSLKCTNWDPHLHSTKDWRAYVPCEQEARTAGIRFLQRAPLMCWVRLLWEIKYKRLEMGIWGFLLVSEADKVKLKWHVPAWALWLALTAPWLVHLKVSCTLKSSKTPMGLPPELVRHVQLLSPSHVPLGTWAVVTCERGELESNRLVSDS